MLENFKSISRTSNNQKLSGESDCQNWGTNNIFIEPFVGIYYTITSMKD